MRLLRAGQLELLGVGRRPDLVLALEAGARLVRGTNPVLTRSWRDGSVLADPPAGQRTLLIRVQHLASVQDLVDLETGSDVDVLFEFFVRSESTGLRQMHAGQVVFFRHRDHELAVDLARHSIRDDVDSSLRAQGWHLDPRGADHSLHMWLRHISGVLMPRDWWVDERSSARLMMA